MEKSLSTNEINGIICEFGEFPTGTIISEEALAQIFGRHQVSIKRAVQRNELPAPIKLMGAPVWTVECLLQFFNEKLAEAQNDQDKFISKMRDLQI